MKQTLFTSLFMLLCINTFAQDTTKVDSIKHVNLSDIQFVGTKQSKLEPISTTHINIDSVRQMFQGQDPFFILNRSTPSIYSQSDNGMNLGYTYTRLRGLDQTRMNFNLNGIPMNEMEDQGLYFSNMPGFWNNISKVDVERGVGTSKYGTTALAGSVNMETKNMLDTELNLSYGVGSYNTKSASGGYSSGKLQNNMAFAAQGSYSSTDGFKEHSGSTGGNIFGEVGYFGKHNIFKVYGFYGFSRNQMSYATPTKSQIDTNYDINLNLPDEKDNFTQSFIVANWVNYKITNLTFNTSVYSSAIKGSYSVFIDPSEPLYMFGLSSQQTGAMSNAVFKAGKLSVNFGVNFNYYTRMHNSHYLDSTTLFYTNRGYKQDFISYLKLNYPIGNLNLFAEGQYRGVSFDYKEYGNANTFTTNWAFFNPKIGAKYIKSNYDIYFSAAHSNREPTRSDLFNGYDNITPIVDKQYVGLGDTFSINLKPESVYDLELGSDYHKGGLSLSGNLYFMNFNNELIAIGRLNYIGLPIKKNISHSIRTGFEANVSYRIGHFILSTNGCLSYNKIDTGAGVNVTPYATPNLIVNNSLMYKRRWFAVGLNGMYVSKTYLNNKQDDTYTTPSYYIVGAVASVSYNSMCITFNANNLLNQKYYLPGVVSTSGESAYYVGALANYYLTLRLFIK